VIEAHTTNESYHVNIDLPKRAVGHRSPTTPRQDGFLLPRAAVSRLRVVNGSPTGPNPDTVIRKNYCTSSRPSLGRGTAGLCNLKCQGTFLSEKDKAHGLVESDFILSSLQLYLPRCNVHKCSECGRRTSTLLNQRIAKPVSMITRRPADRR
jgi:hypothetical protein